MKALKILYTAYALLVFILTFLLLFPLFLLAASSPKRASFGRRVNQHWARVYFSLIGKTVQREGWEQLPKKGPAVFIANHFSYLDIAMMGLLPGDVVFVGKSGIGKLPFFGYYFKKLHIAVDRESLRSRAEVMRRAQRALQQGSALVIFPEGGILSSSPPEMKRFKEGAFRIAWQAGVPIVPITLSYNHLILPDVSIPLLNFKAGKMVVHAPIPTVGCTEKNLPLLKERAFTCIQEQLYRDEAARKPEMYENR